jgi:hypothetical protein
MPIITGAQAEYSEVSPPRNRTGVQYRSDERAEGIATATSQSHLPEKIRDINATAATASTATIAVVIGRGSDSRESSTTNNEVERRGDSPPLIEADLSQSSTPFLAQRRRGPHPVWPVWHHCDHALAAGLLGGSGD